MKVTYLQKWSNKQLSSTNASIKKRWNIIKIYNVIEFWKLHETIKNKVDSSVINTNVIHLKHQEKLCSININI